MSSCTITCPFCDLDFEEYNVDVDDEEVVCDHCHQEFSVEYEAEITCDVTECTSGEEYEAKRKIAHGFKQDMYVLYLGMEDLVDTYCEGYTMKRVDYKQAKLFTTEDRVKQFMKNIEPHMYPYAKPMKYRDCEAKENDTKDGGMFQDEFNKK